MSEVGVLAAFAAGVLALLSPCSALLLPSFFAYAFASRRALVARTFVFYRAASRVGPSEEQAEKITSAPAASAAWARWTIRASLDAEMP